MGILRRLMLNGIEMLICQIKHSRAGYGHVELLK